MFSKMESDASPTQLPQSSGASETSLPSRPRQKCSESPFYLHKPLKERAELTGDMDLITHFGLRETLNDLRNMKTDASLASFLPEISSANNLVNTPDSTLLGVLRNPPIGRMKILPLTELQLSGFRLQSGISDEYDLSPTSEHENDTVSIKTAPGDVKTLKKKSKKKKRHEHDDVQRKKRKMEEIPASSNNSVKLHSGTDPMPSGEAHHSLEPACTPDRNVKKQ